MGLGYWADDMILSYTGTIMESENIGSNRVRQERLARRWSQADLASRAGISRAAVSAIEMNRLVPSVASALAVAAALETSVEVLFGCRRGATSAPEWAWWPTVDPCRYWLAEVAGQTLRFPVEPPVASAVAHDGVCRAGRCTDDPAAAPLATLVVAGCDPAAGLLAAEFARTSVYRMLYFVRSGRRALDLLARRIVHAAGIHFSTGDGSVENERVVRDAVGHGHRLLRVARWEAGLAVSPSSAVRSVREAVRADLRWVGREPGSAARECQDELRPRSRPPRRLAFDHRGVAEAVRCGWADVGVCHRLAGEEAGLRVLTVRREDYDLCYSAAAESDARVSALVRVVRSAAYRQLSSELPGIDSRHGGEMRTVE